MSNANFPTITAASCKPERLLTTLQAELQNLADFAVRVREIADARWGELVGPIPPQTEEKVDTSSIHNAMLSDMRLIRSVLAGLLDKFDTL